MYDKSSSIYHRDFHLSMIAFHTKNSQCSARKKRKVPLRGSEISLPLRQFQGTIRLKRGKMYRYLARENPVHDDTRGALYIRTIRSEEKSGGETAT